MATTTVLMTAEGAERLERQELGEADTLDGGTLLPGFTCSVAELFD